MAAIYQVCWNALFNENVWIFIIFSLRFVSNGPINNIPALVQAMYWRRPGDKPSSKTMMVSLLTHLSVTSMSCTTTYGLIIYLLFYNAQHNIQTPKTFRLSSVHSFREWCSRCHRINTCLTSTPIMVSPGSLLLLQAVIRQSNVIITQVHCTPWHSPQINMVKK